MPSMLSLEVLVVQQTPSSQCLFFLELSSSRCNGEGENLGNFVKVVKTLVVISTSNNVVKRCNKLTASPGGHVSSKL